jgi:hypothetical protein
MTLDWFLIILAITTLLRGLGAGIISGIILITLPVRKRIGLVPYAGFTRALYKESGVKVYAGITMLGALLTIVLAIWTFSWKESAAVSWLIGISLVATSLGFVGTGRAFPTMRKLWQSSDDEALVSKLLDHFARWGTFSAAWHIVAFASLVVALEIGGRL